MGFNIADLFERAVDAVPDRDALIIGGSHTTYAELERAANRVAHGLADRGVGTGDHVGIYGHNSLAWVQTMLAAFKLRAVPININYRYVEDELAYLFDNARLAALVFDQRYAHRVASVRSRTPDLRLLVPVDDGTEPDRQVIESLDAVAFDDLVAAGSPDRDFAERSPDDRYVLYTGGTTGMPKGVVWRQEDVFFALGGGCDAYTNQKVATDRELADRAAATEHPMVTLCIPPLMHGAAQWATMRFWFEGGTVVFTGDFDPVEVWAAVERDRVNTAMITGDAMGRPLVEALEADPDRFDLSSLAVLTSSAAVFSPTVKDRFLELLPDLLIIDAIGSSESGHNGMVVVRKGETAMLGGGPTVAAGADAVVLDDDLEPVEPGSGVVGRLGRGGNIPVGYFGDEAKTAATFVVAANGRRYAVPGDFATVEADGSITLLGRGSVCINSGGEKIYPEEVESALKAHPAVFDAVVVGVDDERWGQRVAAVVQPRPDQPTPTLDQLDAHCRGHLAGYKVPRQLHLVDQVVRSPAGKPDYRWAAAVASGG